MAYTIKNITFLIVLIVSCFLSLKSQNNQFVFDHITPEQGLPCSAIKCFHQDRNGFMWIGSYDGLIRYNGYTFNVFYKNPHNKNSVSHNHITKISEDRPGFYGSGRKTDLIN